MILTPAYFTIRGPFGSRMVQGIRCGEWATYRLPERKDLWVLTLMPLGFSLPMEWASFARFKNACLAMMKIQRMRNSWAIVTQDDFTPDLRDKLMAICRQYKAVEGPITFTHSADAPIFGQRRRRVNGYPEPDHGAG